MQPSKTLLALLVFMPLLLSAGCDRGSHPSQIGKAAPEFTVSDANTSIRLGSLRGKIVVLNFWATWCPPCLEELPALIALQHRMPQVVVLAVSTDEDQAVYSQFVKDNHLDLLTVNDGKRQSSALYGTFRYPETYIIDQQGILRRKFVGAQNWVSPEILSYLQNL